MFQAVRTCQLELATLPALCQELLANWPKVLEYLNAHAPPHEMMGVRKQVSFRRRNDLQSYLFHFDGINCRFSPKTWSGP